MISLRFGGNGEGCLWVMTQVAGIWPWRGLWRVLLETWVTFPISPSLTDDPGCREVALEWLVEGVV